MKEITLERILLKEIALDQGRIMLHALTRHLDLGDR